MAESQVHNNAKETTKADIQFFLQNKSNKMGYFINRHKDFNFLFLMDTEQS